MRQLPWAPSPPANHEALLSELDRFIKRGVTAYLRFVLTRNDASSPWEPFFGRIDLAAAGSLTLPSVPDLGPKSPALVVAETVGGETLRRRLLDALNGAEFLCGNISFPYPALRNSWFALWFGGTEESYAQGWPGIFASVRGYPTPREPAGQFPSRDGAFFRTFDALLAQVSSFAPYHAWRDARRNQCNLFLWDQRARIVEVEATKALLRVRLEGPDLLSLHLRGSIRSARSEAPINVPATTVVEYSVDDEPLVGDLCLIDEDLGVVDEVHWDRPMAAFVRAWEDRQERRTTSSPVTIVADKFVNHDNSVTSNMGSAVGPTAVGQSATATGSGAAGTADRNAASQYVAQIKALQLALVEYQDSLDETDEAIYRVLAEFLRAARTLDVAPHDIEGLERRLLDIFEQLCAKEVRAGAATLRVSAAGVQFAKTLLTAPFMAAVADRLRSMRG